MLLDRDTHLQLSLDALLRSVEDAYPYRATCSLATSEVDPSCQNSHPKDEVAHCTHLLYSREWYRIPLLDMIRQGQLGITGIEGEFSNETGQPSWVVNAHGSEILTMLALNMTFTQELKPEYRIVADCLPAGLEKAEALGYPGKSVMIVLGAGRED